VIRFIYHLEIVTTMNYGAIANLHNLRLTTAYVNSPQSAFVSHVLVTDLRVDILQLLCLRRCPLANAPQLIPRLAAISHRPPSLLFAD
jgi:hypothetical protein